MRFIGGGGDEIPDIRFARLLVRRRRRTKITIRIAEAGSGSAGSAERAEQAKFHFLWELLF